MVFRLACPPVGFITLTRILFPLHFVCHFFGQHCTSRSKTSRLLQPRASLSHPPLPSAKVIFHQTVIAESSTQLHKLCSRVHAAQFNKVLCLFQNCTPSRLNVSMIGILKSITTLSAKLVFGYQKKFQYRHFDLQYDMTMETKETRAICVQEHPSLARGI